jgi:hypothetical protein
MDPMRSTSSLPSMSPFLRRLRSDGGLMLGRFLRILGSLLGLAGVIVFAGQVWIWFRLGEWQPFSVTAAFYVLGIPEPHPVQPLIGLQTIIDGTISFVLNFPASLACLAIAWLFIWMADKAKG